MKIILGTMTFGGQTTTEKDATTMVSEFVEGTLTIVSEKRNKKKKANGDVVDDNGIEIEIDTAIMYQNGKTEHILGRVLPKLDNVQIDDVNNNNPTLTIPKNIKVASKANPFTRDKNLSPTGLRQQLESSLQALDLDFVDLYYLHAPDVHHDIEPTLEEIQLLYTDGKFKRFGLSNFTAWETVYIHNYMSQRNQYIVPTVYQGMHNALARQVETELMPALRKLNMSFYAYNPLAAGMLTGKYTKPAAKYGGGGGGGGSDQKKATATSKQQAAEVVVGTRFAGKSFWAKRYRERYQQNEQFDAVEILRQAIDDYNSKNKEHQQLSMTDASLKWLKYHSCLDTSKGDGIILGASSLQHFRTNWKSLTGESDADAGTKIVSDRHDESAGTVANNILPPDIVKAFEDAWMTCKDVCPDYSRGYSGSAKCCC